MDLIRGKIMSSYESRTWDYLRNLGFTQEATAGIMGNIHAESANSPINLQNSANKRLGMTDAEYTTRVDQGVYTNFVGDGAGYGICQWTYWSRKQALLNLAKSRKVSIGNLGMQIDYLVKELKQYNLYKKIVNNNNIREVTKIFLTQFEKPASVIGKTDAEIEKVVDIRYSYATIIYDKYCDTLEKDLDTLVEFNVISSPDYWRNHAYDLQYLTDLYSNMAKVCRSFKENN